MSKWFIMAFCLLCSMAVASPTIETSSRLSTAIKSVSKNPVPSRKNQEEVAMVYGGADILDRPHLVS